MFSPEMGRLVRQEQHQDRLRELECQQLRRAAGLNQQAIGVKAHHKVISWVGSHLLKLGAKLQSYGPAPLATNITYSIQQD